MNITIKVLLECRRVKNAEGIVSMKKGLLAGGGIKGER